MTSSAFPSLFASALPEEEATTMTGTVTVTGPDTMWGPDTIGLDPGKSVPVGWKDNVPLLPQCPETTKDCFHISCSGIARLGHCGCENCAGMVDEECATECMLSEAEEDRLFYLKLMTWMLEQEFQGYFNEDSIEWEKEMEWMTYVEQEFPIAIAHIYMARILNDDIKYEAARAYVVEHPGAGANLSFPLLPPPCATVPPLSEAEEDKLFYLKLMTWMFEQEFQQYFNDNPKDWELEMEWMANVEQEFPIAIAHIYMDRIVHDELKFQAAMAYVVEHPGAGANLSFPLLPPPCVTVPPLSEAEEDKLFYWKLMQWMFEQEYQQYFNDNPKEWEYEMEWMLEQEYQ